MIGKLFYLSMTRPDISFCVQQLNQYVHKPSQVQWEAATHVIRYLKHTHTTSLYFPTLSDGKLHAYCDSDWATCRTTRRSITGFCIYLGDSLVSWRAKNQTTIARGSVEAEYRAMGSTVYMNYYGSDICSKILEST